MALTAISNGDVILIVFFATIPLAAILFATGAGKALSQIGKGQFAVEYESDLGQKPPEAETAAGRAEREEEIRQLVAAKDYRRRARGEDPLDVEAEVTRLLEEAAGPSPDADPQLVEEVRQLVVARNERRQRQGKEALDVEAEIERQLRELENLGQ